VNCSDSFPVHRRQVANNLFAVSEVMAASVVTARTKVTSADRLRRSRRGEPQNRSRSRGADGKFVPAQAEILPEGTIKVFSPDITQPSAVRYAWFNWGEVSLYNANQLPAAPFETNL
jgi:sialate O-acetylesterase